MAIFKKKTQEKVDFKKNIKTYLEIAKKYKRNFVLIIFLTLIIEGIIVFEKYLFKEVVDRSTGYLDGAIALSAFQFALIVIGAIFLAGILIRVIGHWVQNRMINTLDSEIMFDIKKKFFDHIVHLSHRFHTTHKTGSLISRMNRGSRAVESISDFIIYNLSPLAITIILVGGSLLYFDLYTALVVVCTSVLFILYGFFISNIQQRPQYEANEAEDIEKGNMADIFTNIDSVKYYGKENKIKKHFSNLAEDSRKKLVRFWNVQSWFSAGQSLILGVGTFLLIYFPLLRVMDGTMTVGTLAFIYTSYVGLMGPLFGFVHGIRRFYVALGDLDELFKYEKIKNDIEDRSNAKELRIRKGEIDFDNVEFKYHDRKVIEDFKLNIKPGEKVAFVGHSGSGKTTIIRLLYRLYDVQSGSIKIDGKDIRDVKQETLRSELSIVPQEAILFDDTIYNNIKFSKPSASKKEVMKAIKAAQLDRFVDFLPEKEKTIVGERGVKLSGGEKQRVSIARAILANKKVLVLDEATSALDSKTEHEIQKDLEELMRGRTSLIIAHRLSTIMNADKIVVMDRGKIAQVGKHNTLIKKEGIYKNLWDLQKGGFDEVVEDVLEE